MIAVRSQSEIIADMRTQAGSRQRLAAVAGVSVSAAQGWEKLGIIPEGRSLARLATAYPSLGSELIAVIAAEDAAQEWAETPGPE